MFKNKILKIFIGFLTVLFVGYSQLDSSAQLLKIGQERNEQYRILNLNDGVDEIEASFLSAEYFNKFVSGCGMSLAPKDKVEYWEVEMVVGIAATPMEEKMKINKKTGKIELKGYPTIENPAIELRKEVQNLVGSSATCSESAMVGVPKNLIEAFVRLNDQMDKIKREEFQNKNEEELIEFHFGLGRWLRDEWGLWKESKFGEYFKSLGINHPDDMSRIIIVSYHRYLNGESIDLDGQISEIKEFYSTHKF